MSSKLTRRQLAALILKRRREQDIEDIERQMMRDDLRSGEL